MVLLIDKEQCNGCGGRFRCAQICPSNLLAPDENGKIELREPKECWDCAACLRVCGRDALALAISSGSAEKRSILKVRPGKKKARWSIRFPSGEEKSLEVENREVPLK
ncbi:4Fe-4S dicluster domain-containing protein [Heliobacillus mobilis]|uniref:4Fe-4S dicluster domain-containing protein n=1 Tax=Heliobacterium mobile TaxID=28064 RepID=A0A6I3SJ75_HELMO|nr:4Fe-4S dicluster domain-containing protein [Heliobacterium mobile]MTV48910.1 4Fe-4S dicluster domain-containing protein [Heliobacterium mobile]